MKTGLADRQTTRRGFSVVEILVALVIAVVCLTGVIYLFRQSRMSVSSAEERVSVLHQGRLLLEYLKRDLRCVFREPGKDDSKVAVGEGEISFTMLLESGSAGARTDRVTYAFDKGGRRVTRKSETQGERVFGNEVVKVKDFTVKEEARRVGYEMTVAYAIAVDLTDSDDEGRNRLRLDEKVYPPLLQTKHGLEWVD